MILWPMRLTATLAATLALTLPAWAERIENPFAVFNGLDKITGVTTSFEVKIGELGTFGGLRIHPFVCYTRPVTEEPKTTSFVQVEAQEPGGETKRIFSGWMFAESPGLNAVEHPTFDVWLTGCRDPNAAPPPKEEPPKPEAETPIEDEEGEQTGPAD
jgi:hypothetical protein